MPLDILILLMVWKPSAFVSISAVYQFSDLCATEALYHMVWVMWHEGMERELLPIEDGHINWVLNEDGIEEACW